MANDISEMTIEIQKESQAAADKVLNEAQEKQAARLKKGLQELSDLKKEQTKQINTVEKHDFDQSINRLDLKARQQILREKQTVLNAVFEQAVTEMTNWSAQETLEFILNILAQPEFIGEWELTLGEGTAAKWQMAPTEWDKIILSSNQRASFTLNADSLPNQSGFILSQNGIEYNFLYRSLVQDLQEDLEAKISQQLFD